MTVYAAPGAPGAKITYKPQYDNFIGGKWVAPQGGQYFDNITPVTGQVLCKIARSQAEDIELALDAAHVPEAVVAVPASRKVFRRGRLIAEGRPDAIATDPAVAEAYFGVDDAAEGAP